MNYLPNTSEQTKAMLSRLGLSDVEDLFTEIPQSVRLQGELDLPLGLSEMELQQLLKSLSEMNKPAGTTIHYLGGGVYDHFIPSVVATLVSRSEFLTAYTPYQPEISQGTLQAIFEFQSYISELTGLPVANASLYDGATAVAEAALMAVGQTGHGRIVVPASLDPQSLAVLQTYCSGQNIEVVVLPIADGTLTLEILKEALQTKTAAVIVQDPNFFGLFESLPEIASLAHAMGALCIVSTNPILLSVLTPPGELGADIVVGEGQPLGIPMSFGGPYLGFMAASDKLMRRVPGRIAGATVDGKGRRGYVLTLQAREQHIRRERATSNICSNQALMALMATVFLAEVGPKGLQEMATLSMQKARYLYSELLKVPGVAAVYTKPFGYEFVVRTERRVADVMAHFAKENIQIGINLERFGAQYQNQLLMAVTEKRTKSEMDQTVQLWRAM